MVPSLVGEWELMNNTWPPLPEAALHIPETPERKNRKNIHIDRCPDLMIGLKE